MKRNRVVGALLAGALVSVAAVAAQAADIESPDYGPVYGEPAAPRVYEAPRVYAPPPVYVQPVVPGPVVEERCRIRHRPGVDAYGREIVRRVRICDEGVVEGYAPPPRYAQPYGLPRPPGNVGEGYVRPGPDVYAQPAPPPDWRDGERYRDRRDGRDEEDSD